MSVDKKTKIFNDPDFIASPKYNNSLEEFCARHDDGIETNHVAKVLLMEEDEVLEIYEEAVENLKDKLGVSNE